MPPSPRNPHHDEPIDPRVIDPTRLRWLLWALFRVSTELERMFPGRSFMPEGRLADALAKSIAEALYDLGSILADDTEESHALVVKAALGGKVQLRECPRRLLVLRLFCDGSFEEVYNGPGELAWDLAEAARHGAKGSRAVKLSALREAMRDLEGKERLARIPSS